jgi:GNAT superfamily N-acetyltransferase
MNAQLKPTPVFARETCDTVAGEIFALMETHYAEVAHHPDIPPGCDEAKYRQAEKLNILRIFTIRVSGVLVGYAIFTAGFSLHYKSSFQARQDTLFLHPDYRQGSLGYRFLCWIDTQLKAEGIEIIYQHHKLLEGGRLDLGPLFERMGYKPIYRVYWKRL